MNAYPQSILKVAAGIMALIVGLSLSCALPGESPVPATDVSTSNLLLDANSFPPQWAVNPCDPVCDRAERNGESRRGFGIVGVPGHVIQDVFYFESEWAAKRKFQRYKETDLTETAPVARTPFSPFQPPPEITYRSPIADEQYLGCGVDVVPRCRAGLRYGRYFVYFSFSLDSGYADGRKIHSSGLNLEEIEPILRAMDERVSLLLDIPLEGDENP